MISNDYYLLPRGGCGCRRGQSYLSQNDGREPDQVRFSTPCALIQTEAEGRIITGPITLTSDMAPMLVEAYPSDIDIEFIDASGNVLDTVEPDMPFYVSVPATQMNYLITLIAYIDNCTAQQAAIVLRDALTAMNRAAGVRPRRAIMPERIGTPAIPDCYDVHASISFYINPKPVECGCCSCIDIDLVSDDESNAEQPFGVGCCPRCRGWR